MAIRKVFNGMNIHIPGGSGMSSAAIEQMRRVTEWRKRNPRPLQRHSVIIKKEQRVDGNDEVIIDFLRTLHADRFGIISHTITKENRDNGDLFLSIYLPEPKER